MKQNNLEEKIIVKGFEDCENLSAVELVNLATEHLNSELKKFKITKPVKCSFKLIYTGLIEKELL